jgi:YD repeat-containing protein
MINFNKPLLWGRSTATKIRFESDCPEQIPRYGWVATYGDAGLVWRDLCHGHVALHQYKSGTYSDYLIQTESSPYRFAIKQLGLNSQFVPRYSVNGLADMPGNGWSVDICATISPMPIGKTKSYLLAAGASDTVAAVMIDQQDSSPRMTVIADSSTASVALPAGWDTTAWHRYTLTYDQYGRLTLWADGDLVGQSATATGKSFPFDSLQALLGSCNYGSWLDSFYGSCAFLNIYDRPLNVPPADGLGWLRQGRDRSRTNIIAELIGPLSLAEIAGDGWLRKWKTIIEIDSLQIRNGNCSCGESVFAGQQTGCVDCH